MPKGLKPCDTQCAIREILVRLLTIQLLAGVSRKDVANSVLACIDDACRLARKSEAGGSDAQNIGNVLRTWHRQSDFLTKDGLPKALPLMGKFGLTALIRIHFPRGQIRPILLALQRARLIRKTPKGRWKPTSRYAVFPTLSGELLAHLSEGVSRFIETMTRNVNLDSKDRALFERSAKVRKFPVALEAQFREFTREQATAFLNAVDDWMEAKAESFSHRGRTCTAGVFTFAFMDDTSLAGQSPQTKRIDSEKLLTKKPSATRPSKPAAKSSRHSSSANPS